MRIVTCQLEAHQIGAYKVGKPLHQRKLKLLKTIKKIAIKSNVFI
ncbi:hypothetical protein M2149_000663 [Lachnospiraceae bacterium PFB1-21]